MTSQTEINLEASDAATSDFFRCPVQADQGAGVIHVGRKKLRITVQETSIDGFTILVEAADADRLLVSKPWVLNFDGSTFEVHGQWFFHSPEGYVQVGLRRLRDLTRPDPIGKRWYSRSNDTHSTDQGQASTLAFAGFVLFLVTAMAMPGLGDKLGTAEPMGSAFKTVFSKLGSLVGEFV